MGYAVFHHSGCITKVKEPWKGAVNKGGVKDSKLGVEVEHLTVTISGEAQGCGRIVNLARRDVPGLVPMKTGPGHTVLT